MSIRLIAKDLYRLQQKVDRLEKELLEAPMDRKEALKDKLRIAMAERNQMRRILDGKKDAPSISSRW